MKLLTNKTYVTRVNNWYAPTCEFHENHKSILGFFPMDTTSSAGDWAGFFLQKVGKNTVYAIGYEQENNYPHYGFTLYTAERPFFKGHLDNPHLVEDAKSCWYQFDVPSKINL